MSDSISITDFPSHFSDPIFTNMKSSAIAGSLAACAGLLGKLGADGETALTHSLHHKCVSLALSTAPESICDMAALVVRAGFIGLMLVTNGVMLTFFVKGLHETDSLTATVTSTAVNFIISAAGGLALFGEHLSAQWFLGATIILVGMGLLLYGDYDPDKEKHE